MSVPGIERLITAEPMPVIQELQRFFKKNSKIHKM